MSFEKHKSEYGSTKLNNANKRHPTVRYGKPEDISNVATFLLDSENNWITGQILGVDGGIERKKNIQKD